MLSEEYCLFVKLDKWFDGLNSEILNELPEMMGNYVHCDEGKGVVDEEERGQNQL